MAKRGKLKERPRELSVRPTTTRHYKELFLIVCEDESTEPAYFRKVFQERFEDAFSVAAANDIDIAYSNECFELWLLLHFVNVNNSKPIPRKATEDVDKSSCLYGMLENSINTGRTADQQIIYDNAHHSKPFISVEELISIIMKSGDEVKAIERAQNLDASQQVKKPIEANPNTTVYKLVKELREWLEFYGQ